MCEGSAKASPFQAKVTGRFDHELLLKLVALCANTYQPPALKALSIVLLLHVET